MARKKKKNEWRKFFRNNFSLFLAVVLRQSRWSLAQKQPTILFMVSFITRTCRVRCMHQSGNNLCWMKWKFPLIKCSPSSDREWEGNEMHFINEGQLFSMSSSSSCIWWCGIKLISMSNVHICHYVRETMRILHRFGWELTMEKKLNYWGHNGRIFCCYFSCRACIKRISIF